MDNSEDKVLYYTVINEEEQYSIWPEGREVPLGWRIIGEAQPKDKCLDYIEEVWTDMRPLSLRKHMEEQKLKNQTVDNEE